MRGYLRWVHPISGANQPAVKNPPAIRILSHENTEPRALALGQPA